VEHGNGNPGIVRIPATMFGSGIKDGVLERAFGLSPEGAPPAPEEIRASQDQDGGDGRLIGRSGGMIN
jgi:hypothetical protein